MKKHFTRTFTAIFLGILFVSCNSTQTGNAPSSTQNFPTPSKESTPTSSSTSSATPAVEFMPTPIATPFPTTFTEATIETFGSLCINSKDILGSEISPNGKWITSECIGENGTEDSPLRIVSMDRYKDWKIYFRDYDQGPGYDHKSIIIPYRWSKDGKFLYSVSPTKLSGCCWIGGKYVLLVRLNLETGEQVELLNVTDPSSHSPITFTISDNDRYLMYTPLTYQEYDFVIQDLLTWETRVIDLEFLKHKDLSYAVMSPDENKIVMALFEEDGFDFRVDSIALVDLKTGNQKLLVSSLKQGKELYPIHWVNDDQVLLSSTDPNISYSQESAEYWLLNILTGELVQTEKP